MDLKLLKDICSSAVLHSKSCQLHFDAELFTLSNAIPNAGIHYTCQIPHDRIFSESSLVAGDPKSFINVEINVESLLKTLKTISSNNSVRLKLKHRSPPHQGSYFIITSMQCLDNETFYPVSHEIAVIETPHVDYPSMDFSDPGVVLLELQISCRACYVQVNDTVRSIRISTSRGSLQGSFSRLNLEAYLERAVDVKGLSP